jgi:hypothetical protein
MMVDKIRNIFRFEIGSALQEFGHHLSVPLTLFWALVSAFGGMSEKISQELP